MFANDMLNIATDLITKYGDDAVLVEVQMGIYDPLTGEKDNTYISHNIKLIQENLEDRRIAEDSGYQNEIILNKTVKFSFVSDLPVDASYYIEYRGQRYQILKASPISTQNLIVLWETICV